MDYLSSFRPIFVYAAHLRLTIPGQPDGGCGGISADATAQLEGLLARAYATCHAGPGKGFERAWLALAAWLDEALGLRITERYFPGVKAGEAFFENLDALLADDVNKIASGDVIRVYATALALQFTGRCGDPASLPELENYRQRCRKALLRRGRTVAPMPKLPATGQPALTRAAAALLWLVPPAVTLCLYAVYRMLLADLYARVVG